MLHGDGQYHPKYIIKMFDILENNRKISAVTGSRMINRKKALKGRMPIYKFIIFGFIFIWKSFIYIYNSVE